MLIVLRWMRRAPFRRLMRSVVSVKLLLAFTLWSSGPAYAGFFRLNQEHGENKAHPKESSPFSPKEPVTLTADTIDYDQENDLVYASGNVEIAQGQTIILADEVSYDRAEDEVIAEGNISMLEPSGNVYFADALQFQNELKTGVIQQFKARLPDGAVAVAAHASKVDESVVELFKAAYTPCHCQDENGQEKSPFWAIRADKVTIDQDTKEMRYDNATLDIGGTVPVMYTPYFSHSTPGADNESGLLTPSFLRSRSLGFEWAQPVYYAMAPDRDVTITPLFTSHAGTVMKGDYRQKFDTGQMDWKGSITNAPNFDSQGSVAPGHEVRGNIDANGAFTLSDHYDWGFNISRATDDTYLKRYNFSNVAFLNSRVYAEGYNFIGSGTRTYGSVEGLSFQGLTGQDNSKVIPIVAPLVNFNWQGEPGWRNSRLGFDGGTMLLYRETGAQSRRLSSTAKWSIPYVTDDGQIVEVETQLRTDLYDVNNVQIPGGRSYSGVTGREVPQVSATWHYPFVNHLEVANVMVEPVTNLTVSPYGGNPPKIPNEDSVLPDFTDANLFSANRFAGVDRVESGPRMSYGVRGQAQMDRKVLDGVIGQQYRVNNDPNFPITNDRNSHLSDYVGRVGMNYLPYSLGYRFRLDKTTLAANRTEIDAGFNQSPINIIASYLDIKNDPVLSNREVVTTSGAFNVTRDWSLLANTSRDLRLDQTVTASTGLVYKNECVTITTMLGKDYTTVLDIKPSLNFWFTISLKNLE